MKISWLLLAFVAGCGGTDSALSDAGSDGSAGSDATMPSDGATTADASDAAPTNDAASDGSTTLNDAGNPTTIPCGNSSCSGTDVCCVDTTQNTPTYTCAASCATDVTTLRCIGNDCGSQVCCVFIDQQNQVASQCQVSCNAQNEAQLCQDTDAGPTGCSSNQPCSSQNIGDWNLTLPFGTCGGKGN